APAGPGCWMQRGRVFGVDQQDRIQMGYSLHAFPQNRFVARRELVDAARAHERLEADHSALGELLEVTEVVRDETAPPAGIEARRALRSFPLEVERLGRCSDREVVERHVDETRVAAGRQRGRARCNRLPFGSTRVVEMDVRVHAAGEDMHAGGVYVTGRRGGEVRADRGDGAVRDADVRDGDGSARDDAAASDDQVELAHAEVGAASSSRNLVTTSIATATSSVVTDSAGL